VIIVVNSVYKNVIFIYKMPKAIDNFDVNDYNDDFIKNLYTEDFHNYHIKWFRKKNYNFAKIIYELYNFDSVVDLGCSIGTFLEPFFENGKKVQGYEYCYEESVNGIKQIDGLIDNVKFGDVTKEIDDNTKYDCSVSIEVAEHIPTEYSESLVKNLIKLSKGTIIFTAAHPGQGGTGHINCQKKEFWIRLFEKNGYKHNNEELIKIKTKCIPSSMAGKEDEYPYVWKHVYENLMVFTKSK